jgi:hypothetical protein
MARGLPASVVRHPPVDVGILGDGGRSGEVPRGPKWPVSVDTAARPFDMDRTPVRSGATAVDSGGREASAGGCRAGCADAWRDTRGAAMILP